MGYDALLRLVQQRKLIFDLTQLPDLAGTRLVTTAKLDTGSGNYMVYIDGLFRLLWTPEPARWWAGPLEHGSYPAIRLVERLVDDLGVVVLSELEFRSLRRHGYKALVKRRMR